MTQSTERIAYVNGNAVPESQAVISVFDRGFRWGDSVYDMTRTFGGEPFKLGAHLDRLYRSMLYTRIDPGLSQDEMERITLEVVEANRHLLGPSDDWSVTHVVSRGLINTRLHDGANVAIYCLPLDFAGFARQYVDGVRVVTPAVRRTPPQSLSPKAKIANKMNHFMAEFEAKEVHPDAVALMLDMDGNVAECTGANFMFVADGEIKVPNRRHVLPGVSMATIMELAETLDIPVREGDYTPFDVYQSDEAFITSTSYSIAPVATLNGRPIGDEMPGPITRGLLAAWSDLAGVNFVDQALSHLPREERGDTSV